MKRAEREAIMRQGVVLPETPRDRRERDALDDDLRSISLRGKPLPIRARNFRPSAEAYLVATRGPLPYMLRLREIEQRTAELENELAEAWRGIATAHEHDPRGFRAAWREHVQVLSFSELNDLIERHNRWYPAESRLPMDPRTGDFQLVNGQDYRLSRVNASWVLERFPPDLGRASAASG